MSGRARKAKKRKVEDPKEKRHDEAAASFRGTDESLVEASSFFFTVDTEAKQRRSKDFFAFHQPGKTVRLLPIRCFGCNNVLGNKSEAYDTLLNKYESQGLHPNAATLRTLKDLKLKRDCCKQIMMTWVDTTDYLMHEQPKLRNTRFKGKVAGGEEGAPGRMIVVSEITRKAWVPGQDPESHEEAEEDPRTAKTADAVSAEAKAAGDAEMAKLRGVALNA